MITCPNCGATARNGAKFCTTCGTRLGGITPAPARAASAADADPEKTTIWAWGAPSDGTPAESNPPATPETAVEWDWPAPFSSSTTATDHPEETSSDESPIANDPSPEEDAAMPDESSPSEHDELTSWAAQWNADPDHAAGTESLDIASESEEGTNTDRVGGDSPEAHVAAAPGERDDAPKPVAMEAASQDDADKAERAARSEASTRLGGEPLDSAPTNIPSVSDAYLAEAGLVSDLPANASVLSAGAANRATELLNELQALLTANDGEPEPSGLPAPIASTLRDALGSESSFDALRTAASQANAHPRDLYALMDLGRQASDILDLLTERDRLRAAITNVLGRSNTTES